MVEHALRHIINIDAVAKYLNGVPVLQCHRCACEADERRMGKRVVNQSGCAYANLSCFGIYFFLKPILPTMGLVTHYNNVASFGQRSIILLKLLHRCKDDAIGGASIQQFTQMLTGRGLHRHLTQEIFTFGKLSVELIVKVVAVGDYNDGGL